MEINHPQQDNFLAEVAKNIQLSKAYNTAKEAHDGQQRKDGSPYFTHCEAVAKILCEEWGVKDTNILSAGLLHDTVEDTKITLGDLRILFNDDVASLVDGVSKFEPEDSSKQQDPKELDEMTVKKVFDKNLVDVRVSLIKLADRLHNMRTLGPMSEIKRKAKAEETMTVYARLAESLGMWVVMTELEDLSLKYIAPEKYKSYKNIIDTDPRNDELFVGHMTSKIKMILSENNVCAKVETRRIGATKLIHKIEKGSDVKSVNDMISFRIVLADSINSDATRDDCYKALGIIRDEFKTNENVKRFDDSYFHPKANNYSSIQITIDSSSGPVEIGIQPESKENFNNWGVVSLINKGETNLSDYALKLVFTPTGQVKFFKKEATGVDYALSISPSMLTQAKTLIIDGISCPISTVIPNNATVKINFESKRRMAPNENLLKYCLPENRSVFLEQLSYKDMQEHINKGRELIQEVLNPRGIFSLRDLKSFEKYDPIVEDLLFLLGCKGSLESLFYLIGSEQMTLDRFSSELDRIGITKENLNLTSIVIDGEDKPGILKIVGEEIEKYKGNIGALNLQRSENSFKLRLVIEDMSTDSKTTLLDILSKRIVGSKISIV